MRQCRKSVVGCRSSDAGILWSRARAPAKSSFLDNSGSAPARAPEPTTLKNEDSDFLKTNYTPQRIVSLQPSATVIIERLGLLERVVACTRYCADVCPQAAKGRAIVADSWTAQAGEILAAKPDLVIASVPYQEKAVGEILKTGIRFLGFAPRTLADIYGDIAAIAGILGASERGDEVIGKMQGDIAAVAARVRAAEAIPTLTPAKRSSTFSSVKRACRLWPKRVNL